MSDVFKLFIAIALSIVFWFVISLLYGSLLEFLRLRRGVSELAASAAKLDRPRMRSSGVGSLNEDTGDRSAIESVRSQLVAYGSTLTAFADAEFSASILKSLGYDPARAGAELNLLAADLEDEAKRLALIRNIRGALKLKT